MVSEVKIGKEVQGSYRGQVYDSVATFTWIDWDKTTVNVAQYISSAEI